MGSPQQVRVLGWRGGVELRENNGALARFAPRELQADAQDTCVERRELSLLLRVGDEAVVPRLWSTSGTPCMLVREPIRSNWRKVLTPPPPPQPDPGSHDSL